MDALDRSMARSPPHPTVHAIASSGSPPYRSTTHSPKRRTPDRSLPLNEEHEEEERVSREEVCHRILSLIGVGDSLTPGMYLGRGRQRCYYHSKTSLWGSLQRSWRR